MNIERVFSSHPCLRVIPVIKGISQYKVCTHHILLFDSEKPKTHSFTHSSTRETRPNLYIFFLLALNLAIL